jgi:transposase
MARPIKPLTITSEQQRELRSIVNRQTVAHREHRRAWIILNRADGISQIQTAAKVGVTRAIVIKWEQRFRHAGLGWSIEPLGVRQRTFWLRQRTPEALAGNLCGSTAELSDSLRRQKGFDAEPGQVRRRGFDIRRLLNRGFKPSPAGWSASRGDARSLFPPRQRDLPGRHRRGGHPPRRRPARWPDRFPTANDNQKGQTGL